MLDVKRLSIEELRSLMSELPKRGLTGNDKEVYKAVIEEYRRRVKETT